MNARLFIYTVFFLSGCYPATQITGSWKNPNADKTYHTIFVSALTGNTLARSTIETEMTAALAKKGLTAIKSMDEFPPGFSNDSVSKSTILEKVRAKKSDAILTISVLKKETESRYVSGAYAPMSRWDYYNNFWGYYNYWYPNAFSPGYYRQEDIYYLESNLYDAQTEALLWSAQSRTYSYEGLPGFSKEFAVTMVSKMYTDGVLK